MGHRDVCSITKDGIIVLNEGTEELNVEQCGDGFLKVRVIFQNHHETLSIGTGKPGGRYEGAGTDQYIFNSIEVEFPSLNPIRQFLVNRLWRGIDPFRGFPDQLFEFDLQGWGSRHGYLTDAINLLRPSVIVEVGVWKGACTVFMAESSKAIGLNTVVIAVDTWLGSSEHWLRDEYFSQLGLLNGFPALYYKFVSNVIRAGVSDRVLPIPLASVGAAEILKSLRITADIIHIDAAHDYDSVTADLRAWWSVLAPGGLLIGDDYVPAGGWGSVRDAFNDFFGALSIPIENADGKCRVWKGR